MSYELGYKGKTLTKGNPTLNFQNHETKEKGVSVFLALQKLVKSSIVKKAERLAETTLNQWVNLLNVVATAHDQATQSSD